MPFIESNNDSDKLKIYYELYGKDKLDTVVLIHPIGGNIEIWREEISLISKKNLRILAYDLRGHGKSNMGIKNHFTISDLVQDLKKLIDGLDIKECTLIGHSIGGSVPSLYAVISTKYRSNNTY